MSKFETQAGTLLSICLPLPPFPDDLFPSSLGLSHCSPFGCSHDAPGEPHTQQHHFVLAPAGSAKRDHLGLSAALFRQSRCGDLYRLLQEEIACMNKMLHLSPVPGVGRQLSILGCNPNQISRSRIRAIQLQGKGTNIPLP